MALFHNTEIIRDGLILLLDAANPKSYPKTGTTWTDLSRNMTVGTLVNSPTYNNEPTQSFSFNGTNESFSIPSVDLSHTNQITLDFFCRLDSYPEENGQSDVLCEFTTNFNSYTDGFIIGVANDSNGTMLDTYPITVSVKGDVGYNIQAFDKSLVNDLMWHHWVAVIDKSISGVGLEEGRLYIDSIEQTPTIIPSEYRADNTNNFGNKPLYIGARNSSQFFCNMTIGNFKIYDRVLSDAEIIQNFDGMRGRYNL